MIERVIGAFNHLRFDLDDTEIADILWLAVQMRRCNPLPLSELPQEIPAATPEIDPNTKLPGDRQNNSPKSPTKTETSANVYPQSSQNSNETSSGYPIKVPAAQALRNKLDISRSLKPLKRRVPSRSEFILDEIATAERIAEEKLLLPVMCPARDRWLELALVIDEGTSMFLWQQTIKEFKQLLERHGAFRDVRTWGLFTDKDSKVWLRPRIGSVSRQKRLHNPRELIDPNGRRLFIIISDCVSPAWYNGAITKTLAAWANTSPTTIIQVLPEWLWERSALGVAESILLRSLAPGVPNQQLIMTALDLLDEFDVCNRLKIPVVTLEPESLKNWARMVAGAGEVQTKGFLLAPDGEIFDVSSESTENSNVELTAKQRLQRFRLTASPMARKLAGLLAAAPVSLPVVRLIQQTMLDKSSQVHVAEVFLGGILKPLSAVDEDGEADKIQFDFADGVRDLLLDGVPLTESTEVLRKVSEYVAARVGLSVDDFTAMLVNPELGDRSSGVLVRPFAQITAKVLKRLGGKYADLAEGLEQSYQESSQIDTSILEVINALNDENFNVRSNAAKALGKIKSEAAIPGLIKLLEDENLFVRDSAADALGKIKSEAAIPGLIKLLEDKNSFVRESAANSLGKIKSEAAIPGLIKLLEDENLFVRKSAANSLGKIKSEAAIPGLIKLLEDENLFVRKSAANSLGIIKSETAIPGLIKLLEDKNSFVRESAANSLGKIKSEAAIPGLIKLLEDENLFVRKSAANSLGIIKSETAIPGLIKLLEDKNSFVRESAADVLGEIKSEMTIPGLIKLLEDEKSSVRESAADALGEIKSEAAIPGLIKFLEDEKSSVRRKAAYALGKIKSQVAIPSLIKLLKDENSGVRESAADVLGEIKSEAAIPGLIKLFQDENLFVRLSTANALGKIKSEAAIPGLIKLLEDKNSFVRESAANSLGKIKSEAAIPGLIKLLEDYDPFVRMKAADALGEINSEAAIPDLIKLLEDYDPFVRMKAADALGEINSEAAIPDLIKLLEDEDSYVRSSTANTLGKIKSEAAISGLIQLLEDEDSNVRSNVVKVLVGVETDNKQLNIILNYLYQKLNQDNFIEFLIDNYDYCCEIEKLLSATYSNNQYLDFESFVDLGIQILKPDFDGKVYVKYNRYYSANDEGERIVIPVEEADQIHLSKVPEFIAETDGESLGVNLEHEQEIEMVLDILSSGEYELPDSDIEEGTVEISIKEPEFIDDSYDENEGNADFAEVTNSEQSDKSDLTTDFDDIF